MRFRTRIAANGQMYAVVDRLDEEEGDSRDSLVTLGSELQAKMGVAMLLVCSGDLELED